MYRSPQKLSGLRISVLYLFVRYRYILGFFKIDLIENVNVTDKRLKKILSKIEKNNKITTSELAELFNVNNRTILRDIKTLKELKIIERVGSAKSGYWKVLEKKT